MCHDNYPTPIPPNPHSPDIIPYFTQIRPHLALKTFERFKLHSKYMIRR